MCMHARARYHRRCRGYLYLLIAPWKLAGAACVASVDRRVAGWRHSVCLHYWFSPSPQTRRDWSINRESGQTRPWTTTVLSIDARNPCILYYTICMCLGICIYRIYVEGTRANVNVCVRARATLIPHTHNSTTTSITFWCYIGVAMPSKR